MGTLSGGERQALTLLMATLVKPSLLLLDEHTAALDPRSVEQVVKLTERVVSSQRLTTLMVTHSMHQAVRLGDRVLMMHRGRMVREIRGREKQQLEGGEPAGDVRPAAEHGAPRRVGGGHAEKAVRLTRGNCDGVRGNCDCVRGNRNRVRGNCDGVKRN